MWKLEFTPYTQKETVGSVIATYTDDNGVVTLKYEGSVNLDDQGSINDFMVSAKKTLASSSAIDAAKTNLDGKLSVIEAGLNK